MTSIYIWTARTLVLRSASVLVGVSTILIISSWIDGRPPQFLSLILRALPTSVCLGAAWTLSSWRSEGGGIVVASSGRSPWAILLLTLAISGFPFMAPSFASTEPSNFISLTPNQLEANVSGRFTRYLWTDGHIHFSDADSIQRTQDIPAPSVSGASATHIKIIEALLRFVLLALFIYWLLFTRTIPSARQVCLAATLCITAAHLMPWYVH